jgi:hypothetical protein
MSISELVHHKSPVAPVSAIARVLNVDPRTLNKALEKGEIPSIPMGSRRLVALKPFLKSLGLEWKGETDGE